MQPSIKEKITEKDGYAYYQRIYLQDDPEDVENSDGMNTE
jgi:hypothetical protein